MLICPKCNHDNELGRIFCHQCGTKLDISQIKPPSRGGKSLKAKKQTDVGRLVSWTIRLVILGLLGWGIYLIAQVPVITKVETTNRDLVSFYKKWDAFEAAVNTKRPADLTFTQAELNAFIGTMKMERSEGSGVQVYPVTLQMQLEKDSVTVIFLGKFALGSSWEKQLFLSYTGEPAVEENQFVFKPQAARLGALPVPRFLLEHTGLVRGYFGRLFGNLQEEQRLLSSATEVASDTQNAVVRYQPPVTAP